MGRMRYFGVGFSVLGVEYRQVGALASCCGVNLAARVFGVASFSAGFEAVAVAVLKRRRG